MNKKKRNADFAGAGCYLIGVAVAALIALVLSAIIAVCILNEYIDIKLYRTMSMVVLFLAVFAGTYITLLLNRGSGIVTSYIPGVVFLLLLVCCSLLFFDGISSSFFVGFLCDIGGATAAILLKILGDRGVKRGKRRARAR